MSNDLYFIDEAEHNMGRCLVLKTSWSDSFIDVLRQENISVLRLTESMGWKEKEISFIEKLKDINLRGVEIYSWDVKDVTPLQHLTGLSYIGLQCEFTKAPNFSSFKDLTHLCLFWRQKADSVFDCSGLKTLNIVNYPSEDFRNLRNITGLERLQITSKKLVSLSGIEKLQYLKILDLAECSKLESLSGIEQCRQLRVVELENCKKINNVSDLGELINLRDIVLTDCGKVKSLRALANCQLLENLTFAGDTNVEDGELTPLFDIPNLKQIWFADRRHYSQKRDQIAKYFLEEKGI